MVLLIILVVGFVGYVVGRISHIIGGQLGDRNIHVKYSPHHWVFGLLILVFGVWIYKHDLGFPLAAFGLGMIISDLNDLLHTRVFDASHEPEVKKFWGID